MAKVPKFMSKPIEGVDLTIVQIIEGYTRAKERLDEIIDRREDEEAVPFVNAKQIRDLMDPNGMWSYSFAEGNDD